MPNKFEGRQLNYDEALDEVQQLQEVLKRRRADKRPRTIDIQEADEKVDRIKNQPERNINPEARDIEELFDVVLFDWDGVMYDSMENIARYAQEVCRHFGKDENVQNFLASYDQPFWDYYERQGIPCKTAEERADIYSLYHDQIRPVLENDPSVKQPAIFPEIIDTLKELRARGLKIGIVSAHKPNEIIDVLTQAGLADAIDFMVGLAHNKAEGIATLCKENGFDPERVLMLGDLPSDLRDGRAAGVKVGAVARFPEAEDRLGSYDPDYLVGSVGPELFKLKTFEDKE